MHPKEVEKVSSLEPIERYKYFIKKVADTEKLYILKAENGDYAISTLDEHELFPLWSAKEFAELCKLDDWKDHTVYEITLEDFENELIDFITESNYLINVFPVFERTGFIVNLNEFAKDLSEELKNY